MGLASGPESIMRGVKRWLQRVDLPIDMLFMHTIAWNVTWLRTHKNDDTISILLPAFCDHIVVFLCNL